MKITIIAEIKPKEIKKIAKLLLDLFEDSEQDHAPEISILSMPEFAKNLFAKIKEMTNGNDAEETEKETAEEE